MNLELRELAKTWRLAHGIDIEQQINALLEPFYAADLLPDGHFSTDAVLLGEQYHLGGAEDTWLLAEAVGISAFDRVVDLACYVGGPARQLARDYGCEVVGVDVSPVHIEIANALTRLCHLEDRVSFICAPCEAIPLPDASFTVAWSQCSFPSDLGWLSEIDRLLKPNGRLAITSFFRRSDEGPKDALYLKDASTKIAQAGYKILKAQDIAKWELEHGWLKAQEKLQQNEAHYRQLMGDEWIANAHKSLEADIEQWRSGKVGNGRIVAVKCS